MTSLAHAFEFDGLSDKQLVRERERLDALARDATNSANRAHTELFKRSIEAFEEAAKEPKAND
jgi:hypothetical protein